MSGGGGGGRRTPEARAHCGASPRALTYDAALVAHDSFFLHLLGVHLQLGAIRQAHEPAAGVGHGQRHLASLRLQEGLNIFSKRTAVHPQPGGQQWGRPLTGQSNRC